MYNQTIPCPKDQSIETWSEIVFAVIGEQLDDHGEIVGTVIIVNCAIEAMHCSVEWYLL